MTTLAISDIDVELPRHLKQELHMSVQGDWLGVIVSPISLMLLEKARLSDGWHMECGCLYKIFIFMRRESGNIN